VERKRERVNEGGGRRKIGWGGEGEKEGDRGERYERRDMR
jgi:hypothetical protein